MTPKSLFISRSRLSAAAVGPVLVLVVTIMADMTGSDTWLRQLMSYPLQPIQHVSVIGFSQLIYPFTAGQSALESQRRVQLISQQYTAAAVQLEAMEQLKAENEALRKLLNATSSTTAKRVLSAPVTAFGTAAIGVGSEQGVQIGNLVFIDSIMVGRVSHVEPTQAVIELVSSRESLPILARTESGIEGLVKGDGRRLLLTELPLNQAVLSGERVTTVGQLGVPSGLLLGQVSTIESPGSAAAQTVTIDQLVSFFAERVVEVQL